MAPGGKEAQRAVHAERDVENRCRRGQSRATRGTNGSYPFGMLPLQDEQSPQPNGRTKHARNGEEREGQGSAAAPPARAAITRRRRRRDRLPPPPRTTDLPPSRADVTAEDTELPLNPPGPALSPSVPIRYTNTPQRGKAPLQRRPRVRGHVVSFSLLVAW